MARPAIAGGGRMEQHLFRPLTTSAFIEARDGARLYCRPTCFVERPHELDDGCRRVSDTLLWFAAWHMSLRDEGIVKSAIVPVVEFDGWVAAMPAALAAQAAAQQASVARPRGSLQLGERTVRLNEPQLMGILNMTPDSFSDGGKHIDRQAALDAGFALASAGAAIIDIGGESTRPGAPLIWEGDEIERVEATVAALAKGGVAVSIDTRKAAVMEAALAAGATMVNDISALRFDDRAMDVVVQSGCAIVLMHAPSAGSDPHADGTYAHSLFDVYDMLADRVAACIAAGVDPSRIIVDPGIGFGKNVAGQSGAGQRIGAVSHIGMPHIIRRQSQRLIGALDNEASVEDRLGGSVALHYQAAARGAQLLRVHDVAENRQALRVWRGLRDAAVTA